MEWRDVSAARSLVRAVLRAGAMAESDAQLGSFFQRGRKKLVVRPAARAEPSQCVSCGAALAPPLQDCYVASDHYSTEYLRKRCRQCVLRAPRYIPGNPGY